MAALLAGACNGPALEVGHSGVMASTSLGTLEATLPPTVSVLAIGVAAENALRARGFTTTSRSASEDHFRMTARQAAAGMLDSVSVWVDTVPDGPGLRVRFEPLGDETRSRVLMEAILAELGLRGP